MVKVSYKVNKENVELKLQGHANYAEQGKDIVCSAISTLALTLVSLGAETEEAESGYLKLTIPTKEARYCHYLDFVLVGLGRIAEEYPDHIEIKVN